MSLVAAWPVAEHGGAGDQPAGARSSQQAPRSTHRRRRRPRSRYRGLRSSPPPREPFRRQDGKNFCAPKPGFTVMTSTISTRSSTSRTASTGVPGLIATPACLPSALIRLQRAMHVGAASAWTRIESAPAFCEGLRDRDRPARSSNARRRGTAECGRMAFTISGPNVMLGTKWPSITSRCNTSASAASRARTSSRAWKKSLERTDGRIFSGGQSRLAFSRRSRSGDGAAG